MRTYRTEVTISAALAQYIEDNPDVRVELGNRIASLVDDAILSLVCEPWAQGTTSKVTAHTCGCRGVVHARDCPESRGGV